MTRVFIGNPPWTRPGFYGVRAGSRWPHLEDNCSRYMPFPFFMAYAAAVLEKHGYTPRLVDAPAERIELPVFLHKLKQSNPDLIVLETSTPSFPDDLDTVSVVRRTMGQDARIALCGPNHLMIDPAFLESNREVDFVFRGEYELLLLDLVTCLDSSGDLSDVAGLNYRKPDGTVVVNPDRPLLKDINQLPWPSRHQLPMMAYYDEAGGIPQPSAQMWASRGCPYQCIFCVWPQLVYGGANYRVRDPKDVVAEMEWLVETYGYKSVYFDDDTFNIGKERMLAYCHGIQERNLNVPWAIMARADTMDREILEAMKAAGLFSIKYGVETADQAILDASGKNLSLDKVRDTVAITRDLGIQFHLTFTFGLPGETRETAQRTIDLAMELNPDTLQFSICTPMPGSKYFKILQEKGYLNSTDWRDYTGFNSAVARTDALTSGDLEEILEAANQAWWRHVRHRTPFRQWLRNGLRNRANRILDRVFSA